MTKNVFQPVRHDRAFEAVVRQIEAAILDGTYRSGDHLPSERALVEQFQVGRSSVREALRILESLGMVKTSPGSRSGVQVADSMTTSMTRVLAGALRVNDVPLVDLVEYRMMAGATGNFLAANFRDEGHLDAMREALAGMENAGDDTEAFAKADAAFHTAIQKASGNSMMSLINGVVESAIVNLVHGVIGSSENAALRELFIENHRQLLAAIDEGRGTDAATLARESLLEVYGPQLTRDERARLSVLAGTDVTSYTSA